MRRGIDNLVHVHVQRRAILAHDNKVRHVALRSAMGPPWHPSFADPLPDHRRMNSIRITPSQACCNAVMQGGHEDECKTPDCEPLAGGETARTGPPPSPLPSTLLGRAARPGGLVTAPFELLRCLALRWCTTPQLCLDGLLDRDRERGCEGGLELARLRSHLRGDVRLELGLLLPDLGLEGIEGRLLLRLVGLELLDGPPDLVRVAARRSS
eukprot:8166746-Alexandrium_andersonii.AAC.1